MKKKPAALLMATLLSLALCISMMPVSATGPNFWAVIVCGTPDLAQESDFLYETLTTYHDFTDIYYLHVDTSIPEVDNESTKDNVRWAFTNWLAERSTANDIVFIYMMAHGGGYNMLNYWFLSPNTLVGGRIDLNGDEGKEVRESTYGEDVNHDGDMNDWFGVDECMWLENHAVQYWDDELHDDLSTLSYSRLIFVYVGCLNPFDANTEHCYSGGFIDDLSAPNRIIMTPSNETFPAIRKFQQIFDDKGNYLYTILYNMSFWGEQFISALGRNITEADGDHDAHVSMEEAFDFAWENDPMTRDWHQNPQEVRIDITETPWLDDNANGYPTFEEEHYVLDPADGQLASETHLTPTRNPDINGDGKINIKDIGRVGVKFGRKLGDPLWCPRVDLYVDGKINIKDVGVIAIHFGDGY